MISKTVAITLIAALSTPVVGLAVLLAAPSVDVHWEHQPSHFWLVLGAASIAAVLGWSVGASARKRADGRLVLVAMAFVSSAAFLGLHALATPGTVVAGRNTGFVVAVPIGLLIASGFALWSAIPLDGRRARWVVRRAVMMRSLLFTVVVVWAAVSLFEFPPLDDSTTTESGSTFMIVLGLPVALAFGVGAGRYITLARRRRAVLLVAIAAAWVLLGEAAVAVTFTDSWRVSWWVWHVLMIVAFGAIAFVARRLPDDERFSDLYLDEVGAGTREVSVLFADLQGFTKFSEEHRPDALRAMLNTYFEAVLPTLRDAGGRIDRFIGDAVMVTFNVAADQPDHARRAVRAGLGFQQAAGRVAAEHPDWPRFRVGVNTGTAAIGVVGDHLERDYTVLGDTVNVASHVEARGPAGSVTISDTTRRAVAGVKVVSLGTVTLKTRAEPMEIWRVDDIDG